MALSQVLSSAGADLRMATSRVFECVQFEIVAYGGLVAAARAILLRARGIRVIAVDRQRSLSQAMVDATALVLLLLWVYEIVAHAWQLDFHVGPKGLQRVLVHGTLLRTGGAVIGSMTVLLYAVALHSLGNSWRIGIDRDTPGPLVTGGIFRWTRHPIYVAFDLLFVGSFLGLGRLIFLVLALAWIPLMHSYMVREEQFLMRVHAESYRDYCRCVGRYIRFVK